MAWKRRACKVGLVGIFAVTSAVPALSYASLGMTPSGRNPGQTITDMLGSDATNELNTSTPDPLSTMPDMVDMGNGADDEPMQMAASWTGGSSSRSCSGSPATTAFQAAMPV